MTQGCLGANKVPRAGDASRSVCSEYSLSFKAPSPVAMALIDSDRLRCRPTCWGSRPPGATREQLVAHIEKYADASAAVRTPDLPLYTFQNRSNPLDTIQLTDAGQGNVTGLWTDLGKFKTPTLRGLAARAPYFHNGIAATIDDVVRFYQARLGFVFTDAQRADLVAFLSAL